MSPVKQKGGKLSVKKPEHKVRIVGGMWKRTPLAVADVDGLRPTSERVRETLFNWLVHLRGNGFGRMNCLDLFAGTGALGFEAAQQRAGACNHDRRKWYCLRAIAGYQKETECSSGFHLLC